jgi:hypothetical protein
VKRSKNGGKILVSICCGVLVGAAIGAIHWAIVPHERELMTHIFLGDLVAALSTMIVCLAIQLRQEEVHFASAM